jgi:hypothetical protein
MSIEMIAEGVESRSFEAGPGRLDRSALREAGSRICHRASLLSPRDRTLVIGLYEKGLSAVDLARLLGLNAQTVRHHAARLARHLVSPLVNFILAERGRWSAQRRRVAEVRFLQRRTLRETAVETGLTLHIVRRESAAILAQFEAVVQ